MKTNAQHKFLSEITKPKVFIIRDLYVPCRQREINNFTGETEIIEKKRNILDSGNLQKKDSHGQTPISHSC